MSNKSLLIKAPASIDADLPIWNALKITWNVFKSYPDGAGTPDYQSGPFNANDKFEITEQEAGTNVAISKKNNFGGITISPDTRDITQFTVTVTGDDVYNITHLGASLTGYRIAKVDSMFGEGFDTIANLTNLSYLDLNGANVSGDIAELSTLTNLSYLDLTHTKVTGDVAKLSTLTNLINLKLNSTNVSGDVAKLSTLTKLSSLWLSNTNVSGDLSVLSPTILKISGGSSKGQQKFSWSSSTARSSKTNIPLSLTDGNNRGGWDFGNDLDNFLKDEAACTNYSGNPTGKFIEVKGNRTSASDSAIATLQNNGWTLKIG